MKRINLIDRVRMLADLDAQLQSAARAFTVAQENATASEHTLEQLHIAAVKLGLFARRYIGGLS